MPDLLHVLANGWTAFSLLAAIGGLGGLALVALALLATAWLPAVVRHALLVAGVAVVVGAALFQAGQAKGSHDAFARTAARQLAAERQRAAAAERIRDRIAAQATADLAAARAASLKLQELNHALSKDRDRDRVCVDRDLARRLRAL